MGQAMCRHHGQVVTEAGIVSLALFPLLQSPRVPVGPTVCKWHFDITVLSDIPWFLLSTSSDLMPLLSS